MRLESKASRLIGFPVYAIDSQVKLGEVSEVVVDMISKKISALLIQTASIIPYTKAILFESIQKIDDHHIWVSSEKAVIRLPEYSRPAYNAEFKSNIFKKRLVDDKNAVVGRVQDLAYDAETGVMAGFVVSKGFLRDLATGRILHKMDENLKIIK